MIRILLVEDDKDQAELTRVYLSRKTDDFQLTHAWNTNEAKKYVEQNQFDTILLDYNLPEMTGLELLETIRPMTKDTPIILITGAGNEAIAVEAMKQGVYDYIVKEQDYFKKLPLIIRNSCEKAALERQLRQSQLRYTKLFQISHDAVLILDSDNFTILEANLRAVEIFGLSPSEITGTPLLNYCDESEREKLELAFLRVSDNSREEIDCLLMKDGLGEHWETELSLNTIEADSVNVIQCILRDITEKRILLRQVLKSKMRLQALFDSVSDLISVQDKNYSIVMVNNRFAEWCDSKPELLVGQKCYAAYFDRDEPCLECPLKETFASGADKFIERQYQDDILHIWANPMPGLDDKQEYAIEHIRIITEQRRLEEQLIQSEKLATIGILSSGIAHELRNPLNIIEAARYYLADVIDDSETDMHTKLSIIRVNIQRSSKIISNLLEFSRRSNVERQETDLNYILESTIGLIEKELRHRDILISKNFNSPVISEVNSEGIRHAFLNLIMNAMQAMPEGGELLIRTFVDAMDNNIHVEFEDTGIGIPCENLKNIFMPFYTTKPIGEGTGLGLHIANSIVTHHDGKINVQSEIEKGTKFTVVLPPASYSN
ncbi:MAG: response regulator [Calditrichaeota bacterium]|nr:MAG: response regulator [Calditrichota bacterium]